MVSALLFVGCGRDEVRVYQAPKDPAPTSAASGSSGSTAASDQPPAGRSSRAPWVVPDGWVDKPVDGGMRRASFGVSTPDGRSADISVVLLSGEAGGSLENVNRWRGQLKLAPISAEELEKVTKIAKIGSRESALYDFVSTENVLEGKYRARTLAAVLPAGEATVFFKMTGENEVVSANEEKFREWIASVNNGGPGGAEEPNASASNGSPSPNRPSVAAGPTANMRGPVTPPPATGLPQWEVPTHWKSLPPAPMRLASFEVSGPDGKTADMSVVALGPQAGGTLANLNRWRGQIGLPPLEAADLASAAQPLKLTDGYATLFDMVGDRNPKGDAKRTRILAAIVPRTDRTWFYKLTGDDTLVVAEKAAFSRFVQSVKY
ncbi:MAG: hypothetical protein EXS36_15485 [Pedosphaera sp.]|nr:hypothetical protein [Pedosphaera sp.]